MEDGLTFKSGLNLLALLRQWQKIASQNAPIVQTYGDFMYVKDSHPRTRLLLSLQALEGQYGFENKAEWEGKQSEHRERLAKIKAQVNHLKDDGHLTNDDRKFIRKHLMNRVNPSLDQAMREYLRFADSDYCERLENAVPAGEGELLERLRSVRNGLSHGTTAYSSPQLSRVERLINNLVKAIFLRTLGISDEVARSILKR